MIVNSSKRGPASKGIDDQGNQKQYKKDEKIIFAISAAAPAIPVKPSNPATIATIKKASAQ